MLQEATNIKLEYLFLIILIILVVGIKLYEDSKVIEVVELKPLPDNCKDFNARDFLLSGGSVHPQGINDIQKELQRLRWLCDGGNG